MNRRQFLSQGAGCLLALSQSALVLGRESGPHHATGTGFIYDPIYLEHWLEPGHPESPGRLKSIMAAMQETGLLPRVQRLQPLAKAERYLGLVHSKRHIDGIRELYGHSHDVAVAAVGGALAGVQSVAEGTVRNAFVASRPPGHHARNTGREEGFCLYNQLAVAARYAQKHLKLGKVLIVDWDYHHGDGTEYFFYSDPSVLFFSTHDVNAYPGTGDPARIGAGAGKGYNINVHLDCGTDDAAVIRAFRERLVPAARVFKPDLVLVSAGFDSRVDDLLGCFRITDAGFVQLTRIVMGLADELCAGRMVSVLEGGYNLEGLGLAVAAHVGTLLEAGTK